MRALTLELLDTKRIRTDQFDFFKVQRCPFKAGWFSHTCDYYAGAHRIKMSSPQFLAYLQDKYTAPFDQMMPFDENMLIKLALAPNRDTVFKPAPFAVTDRMDHFKGPRNDRNRGDYSIYDTYTYGDKEKT